MSGPRPPARHRRTLRGGLAAALACLALVACSDGGTATDATLARLPVAVPESTIAVVPPAPGSLATAPPSEAPVTQPSTPLTQPPATAPAATAPPATAPPATAPPATAPVTTPPPPTTAETTPTAPAPTGTAPTDAGAPAIDAAAYAVYDMTSGQWLAGNEADTQRPVASIMKLLTAYVVMQAGDPTHEVTVPPNVLIDPQESRIGLSPGERFQRDLLMRAMLIVSANDAARALAIDLSGSEAAFADRMNAAAAALGMTGTAAVNAVGLDEPGAHSTAHDMTLLASVLLRDETFRATVVRTSASLHGMVFPATNDLLSTYEGTIGVKTGHTTEAGYSIVGAATRNGRTVIATVLGAPSDAARDAGGIALLDWAFANP